MCFFELQQPRFALFLLVIFQFGFTSNLLGQTSYFWDPTISGGPNSGGSGSWNTSNRLDLFWWDLSNDIGSTPNRLRPAGRARFVAALERVCYLA
jgi:hypothetical protein